MPKLLLYGWNAGFGKVSLTKLLRKRMDYSLAEAKAITNAVLERQSVEIDIPDEHFGQVCSELVDLGVKFQSGH